MDHDIALAPSFDPRPSQTKYTHFAVQDKTPKSDVRIAADPYLKWKFAYGSTSMQPFTAPTRNGPPTAYLSNIDTETALLRQGSYAFNTKNPYAEGLYVPPVGQTDLYVDNAYAKYSGLGGSGAMAVNHEYLFEQPDLVTLRTPPGQEILIGEMPFGNPTGARSRQLNART
jgi:hypothetical protein